MPEKNKTVPAEDDNEEDRLELKGFWLALGLVITWGVWTFYLFWPSRALWD